MDIKKITSKNKAMEKEFESEMRELKEGSPNVVPYLTPERLRR